MLLLLWISLIETLWSPAQRPSAYLDPGSGSFILQLIIASLVGGLFALKLYWKKVRDFLRSALRRKNHEDQG